MKVYVAFRGEKWEGGAVIGVAATRVRAKQIIKEDYEGHMARGFDENWDDANGIGAGCDYWEIQEFEVQE